MVKVPVTLAVSQPPPVVVMVNVCKGISASISAVSVPDKTQTSDPGATRLRLIPCGSPVYVRPVAPPPNWYVTSEIGSPSQST